MVSSGISQTHIPLCLKMNSQMLNLPSRLKVSVRSGTCATRPPSGCCTSGMTSLSKHRTCPQASSSPSHTPTHEHPVISAVAVEDHHQHTASRSTSTSSSSIQSRSLGVLGTGLAGWVLQSQFAALADVTPETTIAEQDVTSVLVALDGGSQQTNDLFISIAFTLVIAALSVVTLGVSIGQSLLAPQHLSLVHA